MEITLDTWIISDTHWGHANIIQYCDRPQNHDQLMIDNWKALVQPEDIVLHLGDVYFPRGADYWVVEQVKQLPGTKHLLMGNHDKFKGIKDLGIFEEVLPKGEYWLDFLDPKDNLPVLLSHYPTLDDARAINIHGHTHNNLPAETSPTVTYINVCVENTDYSPVRLRDLLAR